MEDKVLWILLSEKHRTCDKMRELKENFENKKHEADVSTPYAQSIFENMKKVYAMGYKCITYLDKEYPEELRHINHPPPYLYIRGNENVLKYPLKVAVVGSRDATTYGMSVAGEFAHELAANNVCIVSGGAKGVDAAALRGALRTDTPVIAVLGSGIDVDYPKENAELFKKIEEKGAVVSEFPVGMGPFAHNFPMRNRVITAISEATVVVEAAEKSGALISASHAIEQGKTVFAVPGNIDSPNSYGTNELIRDGAMMATTATDILYNLMENAPEKFRKAKSYITAEQKVKKEAFNKNYKKEVMTIPELTPYEKAVVNALKQGQNTYEDLLEFTSMETNKLTSLLTIMEIKGIIERGFSNEYTLNG